VRSRFFNLVQRYPDEREGSVKALYTLYDAFTLPSAIDRVEGGVTV
jgi:hypothetical protein